LAGKLSWKTDRRRELEVSWKAGLRIGMRRKSQVDAKGGTGRLIGDASRQSAGGFGWRIDLRRKLKISRKVGRRIGRRRKLQVDAKAEPEG